MSDDKRERISQRAFELWQADGAEHGRDWEYWLRAEAEIDAEVGAGEAAKPRRKRAAPKPKPAAEKAEPAADKRAKATTTKSTAGKSAGKASRARKTT